MKRHNFVLLVLVLDRTILNKKAYTGQMLLT